MNNSTNLRTALMQQTRRLANARRALNAAEATLAMCAGKLPGYAEERRKETQALVRAALAEISE